MIQHQLFAGVVAPNKLDGEFERSPHVFWEKEVKLLTIDDAFLAGTDEGVLFSACEVFPTSGLHTKVRALLPFHPHCFMYCILQLTKENFGHMVIKSESFDTVVSLITPRVHNYYHFLVDFLPR